MEVAILPLWQNILIFVLASAAIALMGTRLAGLADRLADRTGMGEAWAGAVFLGLVTSLPGLAVSISATLAGRPALALSNILGGIAVQTAFLAIADISYRKANLEHAVASMQNILQIVLLATLLCLALLGLSGPDLPLAHLHLATPLMAATAVLGLYMIYRAGLHPMWEPFKTRETVADVPDEQAQQESLAGLVTKFGAAAGVVLVAGLAVAFSTAAISDQTALDDSVAGALLAGVVTSLPELVTTLASIRRGALTLAVGDIVGGNFFDVLFILVVDVVYLSGSLFHAPGVGDKEAFLAALIILLNMILLAGMLYRQKRGPVNIGLESVLILVVYLGGSFVLLTSL